MSLEHKLTEKQFFWVSLAGVLLLVTALYFGILRPQINERNDLRKQIETRTKQLQQAGFLLGEGPLLRKKRDIENDTQKLSEEWDDVTQRLRVFKPTRNPEVGKIDYKWYLFLTRDRLRKKARAQNIDVPALLGLSDLIESDDVARELMHQLLAVERLVDTAIEYGIADIRSIDPLPPIPHRVETESPVYMEEYPMQVRFEGDMKRLYRLWDAMFQPGSAMMLRNIAMEKTSLTQPDQVRMTATLSSFLFVQTADDITGLRTPPSKPTSAKGF